jgi:hypothetical protein
MVRFEIPQHECNLRHCKHRLFVPYPLCLRSRSRPSAVQMLAIIAQSQTLASKRAKRFRVKRVDVLVGTTLREEVHGREIRLRCSLPSAPLGFVFQNLRMQSGNAKDVDKALLPVG